MTKLWQCGCFLIRPFSRTYLRYFMRGAGAVLDPTLLIFYIPDVYIILINNYQYAQGFYLVLGFVNQKKVLNRLFRKVLECNLLPEFCVETMRTFRTILIVRVFVSVKILGITLQSGIQWQLHLGIQMILLTLQFTVLRNAQISFIHLLVEGILSLDF